MIDFTPVPVTIRGKTYPSIGAAARDLGVHRSTVQKALDEGKPDRVGLSPRGLCLAVRVTVGGVTYPSASKAARATGTFASTILYRHRKGKL